VTDFSETKNYPQAVNFPNGVSMSEIVYSTIKGFRPLTLDLYQPQGKSDPRPVLVFIHGGDWVSGDSRHDSPFGDFPGLLASIAAHGYVVASVNYRLAGDAHFPAALIDVKTAIRFLRAHASDYDLDGTRFAAWGVSAGGNLASMIGVTCGVATLDPPSSGTGTPPSDCVEAVIDWCGLIDLETIYKDFDKPMPRISFEGAFLGCEPARCPLEVAHNASPLTYINAMSPSFLIQHGDADTTVSVKQSKELYEALKAKGVPAELVIYPGVAHMLARPGQTGSLALDPVTDQKAIEKLENFLDTSFPKNAALGAGKPANRAETNPGYGRAAPRPAAMSETVLADAPRTTLDNPANNPAGEEVQLGAWQQEADAAAGWIKALKKAGGILTGLSPHIVAVDLPGRGRFYRLRVATPDGKRLCIALAAQGIDCIPARD
jgi:acetyl esterase/lipase